MSKSLTTTTIGYASAHLKRERVSAALPNPVEWAPELVAEATNGNGHVAEGELEGVGADTSGAADWGLPQPWISRTYVPIPG